MVSDATDSHEEGCNQSKGTHGNQEDSEARVTIMNHDASGEKTTGKQYTGDLDRSRSAVTTLGRPMGQRSDRNAEGDVHEAYEGSVSVCKGKHQATGLVSNVQVPSDFESVECF
tara:strand:+ start:102 stop:443 length:342 start_codon:yes stop_codon:yes gene_type:complete